MDFGQDDRIEEMSPGWLKLIQDKTQEKKKEGMSKLEQFFKEKLNDKKEKDLISYIDTFKNLSESSQPQNIRKSALLGYVCMINAIKQSKVEEQLSEKLIDKIMENTLYSIRDNDPHIVVACAECEFNIMNYFKDYVLNHFNSFLESLLVLVTVQDPDVRTYADNLDSSLKGVINYAFQGKLPDNFNLLSFLKNIIDKITLKHPDTKCVIVSWISCINQIPEINLINILYEFLPELFNMISHEDHKVNRSAKDCLNDFYSEIESGFNTMTYDVQVNILKILIEKSTTNHAETKITAFKWIILFMIKYKATLIEISKKKNSSDKKRNTKTSEYTIKLPNKSSELDLGLASPKEQPFEISNNKLEDSSPNITNYSVELDRQVPFPLFSKILEIIIQSINNNITIKEVSNQANTVLMTIVDYYGEWNSTVKLYEEVLVKYFANKESEILELVIEWVKKLFNKFHAEAFLNFNEFMQKFTIILEHEKIDIFDKVLTIICEIAQYKEEYTDIIISNIIDKFRKAKDLLNNRGDKILEKICNAIKADKVFVTFANVLLGMDDEADFVGRMINRLNLFLLKAKETESLRNMLKKVQKSNNINEKQFFGKLFRTWCINPVSSLILCLIAGYFELSYFLMFKFGELDFSQENYIELAQLVQLLESSVFISNYI